ncbi:MAG TPA: M1 family aminopeptidase [Gemmatimonadaceae bacterium]|nr:M1 family aminopeptidase [Gemmatimonadaceae bacterium]
MLGAPTPDSLAALVVNRFAAENALAFDSVYPDRLGRGVVETSAERKETRVAALHRVLFSSPTRAVLLLSGVIRSDEGSTLERGSDETNGVRRFSGLYEATRSGDSWLLTHQIPLDTLNYLRAQTLHVALAPGHRTDVVDTLAVDVGSPYGLAVRLNTNAKLASVRVNGRAAPHAFGGGVLWVQAPASSKRSQLVLQYAFVDVKPKPKPGDTTAKLPRPDSAVAYGALNNTDVWHPFFGYDSGNDFGPLSVTVTIPAAYRLTTTVPQTESVRNGIRTVHGESMHNQFLLALIYDRAWKPSSLKIGDVKFELFATPEFHFSADTLAKIADRVYHVLNPRFGEPQAPSRYLAVVEDRSLGHGGFAVRMNNAVISGDRASMLDEPLLGPSYPYAHEVSHAWTMNATGLAANFLQEGWASYCESLMLRAVYGANAETAFWEKVRTSYTNGIDRAGFLGGFEGHQSILNRPDNGRIHYFKGSWILHQLNEVLGDSVFDRGMRAYIARSGSGPDGYQEFIGDMTHAAGRDMSPLVIPWLTETYIPDVDARVEGDRLIVSQSQPSADFDLPLDVELVSDSGTVRRPVHLTTRADTVQLGNVGAVSAVRVDPDHHFLLRRHWGEIARFSLHAPNAKSVELSGNMFVKPVPATRSGDTWTVTVPLTEGRYIWLWRVDGKNPTDEESLAAAKAASDSSARAGIRIVRPLQRLADSDAK